MAEEIRVVIPTERDMRKAVAERDGAFDGLFLYGVITTGVFCLPSCPARPARPENLRFFGDAQQARTAGLRACKRCRPEQALAERQGLMDTARYIAANANERLTLSQLAARLEMTPTRFQKAFKRAFGVSPKAFQDAVRLQEFKNSLKNGQPIAQAIFDAGFGSTSRVYGEPTRHLGMTPSVYRAGGAGETLHYACRRTGLGLLLMAATGQGVCFAQFGDSRASLCAQLRAEFPHAEIRVSSAEKSAALDDWIRALDAHVSDNAPRPDVPLDLRGTAFQLKVWRYLLNIAEGDVVSYSEVAAGVGHSKAFRAAASACGANRIAVLLPCHRVLRGDGRLGGYRWGLARKRVLLDAERAREASRKARRKARRKASRKGTAA